MTKHAGDRESDDAVSACRVAGSTVGRRILQRGLWFEEFQIGTTYLHRPGRTVTEADNVLFTTLTMNTQSLHLDAAWAGQQPGFRGERLVNSMFTLSTMVGLSVAQLTLGTIVANLGFSEVSFPNRSSTATRFMQRPSVPVNVSRKAGPARASSHSSTSPATSTVVVAARCARRWSKQSIKEAQ